jgi:hypothetical protein
MATSTPRPAKARTVAAPIPVAAPVTKAAFRCVIIFSGAGELFSSDRYSNVLSVVSDDG